MNPAARFGGPASSRRFVSLACEMNGGRPQYDILPSVRPCRLAASAICLVSSWARVGARSLGAPSQTLRSPADIHSHTHCLIHFCNSLAAFSAERRQFIWPAHMNCIGAHQTELDFTPSRALSHDGRPTSLPPNVRNFAGNFADARSTPTWKTCIGPLAKRLHPEAGWKTSSSSLDIRGRRAENGHRRGPKVAVSFANLDP